MKRVRAGGCISVAVVLALAGCDGDGADQERPRLTGLEREVAAVVEALEEATARRDYARICRDLFSARVRRQAGGEDCERGLRAGADDLREPSLTVRSVAVEGDAATARVIASAQGERPASDTIRLVREEGGFRLAALGG